MAKSTLGCRIRNREKKKKENRERDRAQQKNSNKNQTNANEIVYGFRVKSGVKKNKNYEVNANYLLEVNGKNIVNIVNVRARKN